MILTCQMILTLMLSGTELHKVQLLGFRKLICGAKSMRVIL